MDQKLLLPTPEQVEWANCEIGVIIHLDLVIYQAPYDIREHFEDPIPPSVFDPQKLSTDGWCEAAKALGAKYAVLVAKHGTGFSLWPTEAHDYSVKNTPYQNGEGDIVRDFIASCKKYGLRPGIYCSASTSQLLNVEYPGRVRDGDPVKQERYNQILMQQLTELWTNYGDLFEIWFDGGVIPVEEGGPDVARLLQKLQPNAVVFQGPVGTRSLIRWVGNERGVAPEDCSSLFSSDAGNADGLTEQTDMCVGEEIWCPAESDLPNRYAHKSYLGGWLWREGEDCTVLTGEEIFERYLTSVGRNTNMLVGMVINTDGEFPAHDRAQFARAGELIREAFGDPIAEGEEGAHTVLIPQNGERKPRYLVLREDIAEGERVTAYTVRAYAQDGATVFRHEGKVIGHKRILAIPCDSVRCEVVPTAYRAEPRLLPLLVY